MSNITVPEFLGIAIIALTVAIVVTVIYRTNKSVIAQVIAAVCPIVVGLFTPTLTLADRIVVMISYLVSLFALLLIVNIACNLFLWLVRRFANKSVEIKEEAQKCEQVIELIIPIECTWKVTAKVINDFPIYTNNVIQMCNDLKVLSDEFVDLFLSLDSDEERNHAIKSYFLGICTHMGTLFDVFTRIHVRVLRNNQYEQFIPPILGNRKYEKTITPMSKDNKMIQYSYEEECSLIKSCNPLLHENGRNDRTWRDYLMFALPQITHEGLPVFSFGISVKKKKQILRYLNFIGIEKVIGIYIDYVNDRCQLADHIGRSYYAPKLDN